jgi:hypothetical protein
VETSNLGPTVNQDIKVQPWPQPGRTKCTSHQSGTCPLRTCFLDRIPRQIYRTQEYGLLCSLTCGIRSLSHTEFPVQVLFWNLIQDIKRLPQPSAVVRHIPPLFLGQIIVSPRLPLGCSSRNLPGRSDHSHSLVQRGALHRLAALLEREDHYLPQRKNSPSRAKRAR